MMRRPSRELNIFSMSALDLFASSLGAFILLTLILMPFYLRQKSMTQPAAVECPQPEPAPDCPICPAPEPIPECPQVPQTAPAVIKVADNLLVVTMEWSQPSDVDLHIHTPDGEFYFGARRIPGRPGKFVLDNVRGGPNSIEIWKSHRPTPGRYKICTHLFRQDVSSVSVRLLLDKPTGPVTPPTQTLRRNREETCPLEFNIDETFTYTQVSP